MKTILFCLMLISSSAFAVKERTLCSFRDTQDFEKHSSSVVISISKNHAKFTKMEKKMIHDFIQDRTIEDSLYVFGGYSAGEVQLGDYAGQIAYYQFYTKKIALVHYWPGTNEIGSFYEILPNNKFKFLAAVSGSWIECK